jgi:anti-sigma factor RsiW
MIDPKTVELMNRVLDGAASEHERADLESRLAKSPETRAHYDELTRLVRWLDSVPMVGPPSELRPRVMAEVHALGAAPIPRPAGEGFLAWIRRALAPPALRYASTFGLGVAAGAVILLVVQPRGNGVQPGDVSGAMSTPASLAGSLAVAVPAAGVSGSIAVANEGPSTTVRLVLDEGIEWVFDVPDRAEPAQPVVLRIVKSGETVFEGAVRPDEP